MGEAIEGKSVVVTVTPTISAAAYADGDQIGAPIKLTGAVDATGDTGGILSVTIIDAAKQKSPLNLLFFSGLPTPTSADQAPLDISAAEMVAHYLGRVFVDTPDYNDLAAVSEACVKQVGLMLKAEAGHTDLYMMIQARGTPTYGSTSALTIKTGIIQD